MSEDEAIERIEYESLGAAGRAGDRKDVGGRQTALAQLRTRRRTSQDAQRRLHRAVASARPLTA